MAETAVLTLADFLLARIEEDEDAAYSFPNWSRGDDGHPAYRHINRHSPAMVLAECQAKRKLIAKYRDPAELVGDGYWYNDAIDDALRLLTLPYADHPDFREEWRG